MSRLNGTYDVACRLQHCQQRDYRPGWLYLQLQGFLHGCLQEWVLVSLQTS